MRTLIISVDYPLPENKGNRMRTMNFVRFFQERGDVDLMCYKSHAPLDTIKSPFRNEYHIELNNNTHSNKNFFKEISDKIIDCRPWIVNNFSAETVQYIHNVILSGKYDVILCRYAVNAYPLLTLPVNIRNKVVLDLDDLMSNDLYDAINGEKSGVKQLKSYFDKIIYKKYQVKCMDLLRVLLCSEADRVRIAKYAKKPRINVVPNIAPKQEIPAGYNKSGFGNKYLLFVGVLSYKPNEMGIVWFINEIFNKLPEEFRDSKLLVVGKDPQDKLIELCSENGKIELVMNPPDVLPYFEKCFAVVVPVLIGGGTRIKILEAGNCCRPVLSTKLGAYGLDLKDFESVLYFSEINNFIEKLSWLNNKDNYYSVTDGLAEEVRMNYTENNFASSLGKAIDDSPIALADVI